MKRLFCLTLTLLLAGTCLIAQPKIDKSEIFEEPISDGWTKLMLLKNGNTVYFHYGSKKGIEITVWNKERVKTGTQIVKSENWNPKKKRYIKICGAYEINGEPVVFLEHFASATPMLYRLRFNAIDGSLIKEEMVAKMPKITRASIYRNLADAVDMTDNMFVEKDAESDNYAIIFFNGFDRGMAQRIRVQHFDATHKMINSAYYTSPDPAFKKLRFIGAVVDGNKRVFISTYGAESGKGKNAHVFIACLHTGDSSFTQKQLDFTEDFNNTSSDMVYNRESNSIVMLTNTLTEKRSSSTTYVSFLSYIDAENLSLKGVNVVANEKTNEYAHRTLGLKTDFRGLPQKVVLNRDNTITVLQEEMSFETIYHRGNVVGERTYLNNIGITEIAGDGTEKTGYTLMKHQFYFGKTKAMYMAGRNKGVWSNDPYAHNRMNDNSFMSYEYIHTPSCNYVLFNDNPRNDEKEENEKKRKLALNIDNMNTICYTLKNGVATRTYLFGEPEKRKSSQACYIEASDYNKNTNTYTTVVSEQHGRKYDSRVAWIHFD